MREDASSAANVLLGMKHLCVQGQVDRALPQPRVQQVSTHERISERCRCRSRCEFN
jgi:hypothetical protein